MEWLIALTVIAVLAALPLMTAGSFGEL